MNLNERYEEMLYIFKDTKEIIRVDWNGTIADEDADLGQITDVDMENNLYAQFERALDICVDAIER